MQLGEKCLKLMHYNNYIAIDRIVKADKTVFKRYNIMNYNVSW